MPVNVFLFWRSEECMTTLNKCCLNCRDLYCGWNPASGWRIEEKVSDMRTMQPRTQDLISAPRHAHHEWHAYYEYKNVVWLQIFTNFLSFFSFLGRAFEMAAGKTKVRTRHDHCEPTGKTFGVWEIDPWS